tara:strand:+ start:1939 stop:2169 length:231 start_codon:yes stop_codon:yes gene_type:complete
VLASNLLPVIVQVFIAGLTLVVLRVVVVVFVFAIVLDFSRLVKKLIIVYLFLCSYILSERDRIQFVFKAYRLINIV